MLCFGLFWMSCGSEGGKVTYPFVKVKMSLITDIVEDKIFINTPKDLFEYTKEYFKELDREHLVVVYLNACNEAIGMEVNSIGDLTGTVASPREIYKGAILANAYTIALIHNHPTGGLKFSEGDKKTLRRVKRAGNILQIPVKYCIVTNTICYGVL